METADKRCSPIKYLPDPSVESPSVEPNHLTDAIKDPSVTHLNVENIPDELKALPHWIVWRFEEREGKTTKVPYQSKHPLRRASSTNPATWSRFEEAIQTYKECENDSISGIGFVVTDSPFTGIDIDHCRDLKSDDIETRASQIIDSMKSYAEITPSKTGVRIWVKGKVKRGIKKRNMEIYSEGRYFTVTGNRIAGYKIIESRQKELDELFKSLSPDDDKPQPTPIDKDTSGAFLGDEEIIKKAKAANNGDAFFKLYQGVFNDYPSQSEADLALCSMFSFWTNRDEAAIDRLFRGSGLMRAKWDERHFGDGQSYGQHTIQTVIQGTVEVYSPSIHQPLKDSSGPETTSSALPKKIEEWKEHRTKIPAGRYLLKCIKGEKANVWHEGKEGWGGSEKIILWFEVVEGEHLGKVLPMFLPLGKNGKVPQGSKYFVLWCIANGSRRPPRARLKEMPPLKFKDKVFEAEVVDVKPRWRTGGKQPDLFHYSRVDILYELVIGDPPKKRAK